MLQLIFICISLGAKAKRGIDSSKYHVKAENIKHAKPSMAIDIVEIKFELMLNHVNANSEYTGENIRLSVPILKPISCFPIRYTKYCQQLILLHLG